MKAKKVFAANSKSSPRTPSLRHDVHSRFRSRTKIYSRLGTEVESKTQGSRPRPRSQKNFDAKAKDRPSRGQGPRTQVQVFSKKKVLKKIFKRSPNKRSSNIFSGKKGLQNFFSGDFHLKTKKGLHELSARFLALSNKILTV